MAPAMRNSYATGMFGSDTEEYLKTSGVTGVTPLLRLRQLYGYCVHKNNPSDVCHMNKVVLSKLCQMMKGKRTPAGVQAIHPNRQTDPVVMRVYEEDKQQRLSIIETQRNWYLTEAKRKEIEHACKNVPGPSNFVRRNARMFQWTGSMKFSDWHALIRGPGKVVFYNTLPKAEYELLCELFDIFNRFMAYEISVDEARGLRVRTFEMLSMFEKIAPTTEFAVMVHLIVHYPDTIALWGPTFYYWMYAFERYMSTLASNCKNRSTPAISICNTYAHSVSAKCVGMLFKAEIDAATAFSADGLRIRDGVLSHDTKARARDLVHFPKLQRDRHINVLYLVPSQVDAIFLDVGRVCSIDNKAMIMNKTWKVTAGVRIGGVLRGTRDRGTVKGDNRSGFELPCGELRDSLGAAQVFGAIEYFVSIKVRNSGGGAVRTVHLAKISLFQSYAHDARDIKMDTVKIDNVRKVCYVPADTKHIGKLVLFAPSPEDELFHLVYTA
jgi:hypothetical protein